MLGREATEAMGRCPVAFLPIGCLERHGDHLPMGLDVIKAHGICCKAARALGGVVFPPHYYAGIHRMDEAALGKYTGEWGNLYTDATAEAHLADVIRQIARMGIRVLVLYSGHYPGCQLEMIQAIADRLNAEPGIRVIPFSEPMLLKEGDHAGVCETSLMLSLDRTLVDMTRIGPQNYQDHGWSEASSPEKATAAKGEADVRRIIDGLRAELARHLPDFPPALPPEGSTPSAPLPKVSHLREGTRMAPRHTLPKV
jgi:creatinine amidohydrolase